MDVRPGLANKAMAPFAKAITVTFEKSLADYGKKAVWTGNPSRFAICDLRFLKDDIIKRFNLKKNFPIVFIYGGGTGAEAINKLTEEKIDELCSFCQIIHSTGKGKMTLGRNENYHPFEFLNVNEMKAALVASDLVVSRAGLGALTEISQFAKPAIIIPMPDSHQEDNAALLVEKNAAVVLNQKSLDADLLVAGIKSLLDNESERKRLGRVSAAYLRKAQMKK
jgi:UDP-N-acetylglucosamine--N-acetylmuramyl-(pentapeptide) pyrophosphoryl-undecaprenol N-acetylglucosamine transferase